MTDEIMMKLIENLGDDAKTAFIMYLCFEYGSMLILLGLATWGVRSFWKERKDFL